MKILLLGASGQIGRELRRSLVPLGEILAPGRAVLDLADLDDVHTYLCREQPNVIVNAAAYTAVDRAEAEQEAAFHLNAEVPRVLAVYAQQYRAWLLHYSTDYVFDGETVHPYTEQDQPNPLSAYGRSKLAGEEHVRTICPCHLILRTGWVYSAHGANFPKTILRLAREHPHLRVVKDQFGAPTPATMVADITAHVLHRVRHAPDGSRLAGTYHVAAAGSTSWNTYARQILRLAREHGMQLLASEETVEAVRSAEYAAPARRPRRACLDTTKLRTNFGLVTPEWQMLLPDVIAAIARDCR